jgi:hypothetical protein
VATFSGQVEKLKGLENNNGSITIFDLPRDLVFILPSESFDISTSNSFTGTIYGAEKQHVYHCVLQGA